MAAGSADAQQGYGLPADFSFASLADIDRLIDEHTLEALAIPGGYFDPPDPATPNTATIRLIGLGLYVGEVLVRNFEGEWHTPSADPMEWTRTLRVMFPSTGAACDPVGRVFRRLQNGEEDSVAAFGVMVRLHAGSAGRAGRNSADPGSKLSNGDS